MPGADNVVENAGRGGTQSQGGAAGFEGRPGEFGFGGAIPPAVVQNYVCAGGDGWYGGGSARNAGCGGGSSYYGGAIPGTGGTEAGVQEGGGRLVITDYFHFERSGLGAGE